ncbi:MAG: fumarylacetoacetate hydrolase family protein [Candidatus Omnitrophica bacterium]|nr:fumarylacetoacetate hydrolase family protein [Candidatus Omnitrophota bacterium]
MKIIRFLDTQGKVQIAAQQPDGSARLVEGDLYGDFRVTGKTVSIGKLLAPVEPSQFLCIGLNYRRHAEEGGVTPPQFPVLFMKGVNAVQNPGDPILIPTALPSSEVDYEGELAVVIGKTCKNVRRDAALKYVLGYTCANDVSARDWQIKKGGSQWCRGKTFDTFAPLGPCLTLTDEIPDPNRLQLKTTISGAVMQNWNTEDMIFDVPALIEFLSGSTTLVPGTVILTGTPHGVGMAQKPPRWLKPGDTITIEIEKIGALTNPVKNETA